MKRWLLAAGLAAPAFIPLVAHYAGFHRIGLYPTGFIQFDLPYYVANARELTDAGRLTVLYGNPFSVDYATPKIYFQPLTLIMSLVLLVTRSDPGMMFAAIGFVGAVVCVKLAIDLFGRFTANEDAQGRLPSLMVFIWGGGLLTIVGLLLSLTEGRGARGVFMLDPVRGWWFLNFGRNLVYPTEAIYHAIFFTTIILILDRRYKPALTTLALMSLSHPFTGIQLLAIVLAWSTMESLVLRSQVVPMWFPLACLLLAVLHVSYYLVYLNQFPEHRAVQEQWTLARLLPGESLVVSLVLVGAFAAWRMRSVSRARSVLADWGNRLLLVWFAVSIVLVKHELFMTPIQPLHFNRGYLWIPLFLLGLPAMISLFARVRRAQRPLGTLATLLVLGLALSDNLAWISIRAAQALGIGADRFNLAHEPGGTDTPLAHSTLGLGLTPDQRAVFKAMNDSANSGFVVVSSDPTIGYLTTVYSPLRSWRSHPYNTPYVERREAELRAFFLDGQPAIAWESLPVLFVFRRDEPWPDRINQLGANTVKVIFTNSSYVVVRRPMLRRIAHSPAYSCAGNGSIVSGFTGTCTSSRYGDVISTTRIRGNASMNAE